MGMAISPIELHGAITRTQDYSTIKQNEDNRVMINQQSFQSRFEKEIDNRQTQVNQNESMRKEERRFDARDKGDNQYSGDGGRKRNKEEKDTRNTGKVIIKGRGSFDMKI